MEYKVYCTLSHLNVKETQPYRSKTINSGCTRTTRPCYVLTRKEEESRRLDVTPVECHLCVTEELVLIKSQKETDNLNSTTKPGPILRTSFFKEEHREYEHMV